MLSVLHNPASASLSVLGYAPISALRGGEGWRMVAAIQIPKSLQSSCPRYSDLHRGLSPRLSMYPIRPSSPSIDPSARSIDRSVPINQSSSSLSLTHTHSIHPPTTAPRNVELLAISRSISPINQSIDQAIDQSIHPSTNRLRNELRGVV